MLTQSDLLDIDLSDRTKQAITQAKITQQTLRDLKSLFNSIDIDGSGKIELRELKEIMLAHGFEARNKSIYTLLVTFDSDHNGSLSFDEFLYMISDRINGSSLNEGIENVFRSYDN